ncbi:PD-(D/E)XK nuclease family protein [Haloquadratum walsbyi]|uniref:PD-(D/E)XK nuclease superfamily n=1 Tax=Haloquadratum walsbyi J07HQW2 TaxID=1238425 RepID=U1PJD4_9EURY|nr:PD-(D/E)XK nuclease family protein [Haloquadratum walsbyi]ERG93772.1 MAG: hypothetical protein J07HQW2_00206 [Haloquadratum walsbyi J07HQW2]
MSEDVFDFDATELEAFIQQYMSLDQGSQQPSGIFSILRGPRERQYQNALQYFLNPRKPHGFGYALLEPFLAEVGMNEFNLSSQHIEISEEVSIADEGSERRIDLIIAGGSALSEHPRWAVFMELKVGAKEGDGQTTSYSKADNWNFNWFESNELNVNQLDESHFVYLKREAAGQPTDITNTFETLSWSDIVDQFESEVQDSLYDYPNRSVIQFTDFIQSLKETEGMDSDIDTDELNERLNLYFEHDRLIRQVEKANSQFESDFENVSTYLIDSWENKVQYKFDFENSGWKTSPSSTPKWQSIFPAYWDQDPVNQSSTIKLFFRHSPTIESIRNQQFIFRLRLPPARNVHTKDHHDGEQSFNDVFAEKCTGEYNEQIQEALDHIDGIESRLHSASGLVKKTYPLDPNNLTESYFGQLERAVEEFCRDERLVTAFDRVFEDSYETVFDMKPEGGFPGPLPE